MIYDNQQGMFNTFGSLLQQHAYKQSQDAVIVGLFDGILQSTTTRKLTKSLREELQAEIDGWLNQAHCPG